MGAEKSKYQIENENTGGKTRKANSTSSAIACNGSKSNFKRADSTSASKRHNSFKTIPQSSSAAPSTPATQKRVSTVPPVNEGDIKLVRASWRELTKTEEFKQHGLKYYGLNMMIKIFLKHEDVKPVWKFAANLHTEEEMRQNTQLRSHGNNVFEAINAAINSLDKPEALNAVLIDLGTRHNGYGAKKTHFPIIAEALLETLRESLGENFTPEVNQSWVNIINYFAAQMSVGMTVE